MVDGLASVFGLSDVRALLPDSSASLMKEALMTDFELLSLVISIISLVILVVKK